MPYFSCMLVNTYTNRYQYVHGKPLPAYNTSRISAFVILCALWFKTLIPAILSWSVLPSPLCSVWGLSSFLILYSFIDSSTRKTRQWPQSKHKPMVPKAHCLCSFLSSLRPSFPIASMSSAFPLRTVSHSPT